MASFGRDLWDKFELVSRVASDKLKNCEDLIKIITERANVEESYVKSLEKILTSYLPSTPVTGTYGNISGILREYLRDRADQSRQLVYSMRADVIEQLNRLFKHQTNDTKSLSSAGKKLEKELKFLLEKLVQAKQKYLKTAREYEGATIVAESAKLNSEVTANRKSSLASKLIATAREHEEAEREYRQSIIDYNTFLDRYNREIREILDYFQRLEKERAKAMQDSLFKLSVHESVFTKTTALNVDKVQKRSETIDSSVEIEDFVKEHKTTREFYTKAIFEAHNSFIYASIDRQKALFVENRAHEAILESFKPFYEKFIEAKDLANAPKITDFLRPDSPAHRDDIHRAQRLAFIVHKAWTGDTELSPDELMDFERIVREEFGRKLWTFSFQQYRIAGKFVVNELGYKGLVSLLLIVLNEAMRSRDATTAKKLMVLALTFYKTDPREKEGKVYLHAEIVSHPLWKASDLWESAILDSLREEFANQRAYNLDSGECLEEAIIREKNIVFGQLGSFAFNMLMFEFDAQEVKNLISKFCKHFTLSEPLIKELMSNIEQSHRGLARKRSPDPRAHNDIRQPQQKQPEFISFVTSSLRSMLGSEEHERRPPIKVVPPPKPVETIKAEGFVDPLTAPLDELPELSPKKST
eukprot:TRINITY_DN3858_c0_g1_i1.p1 TRINITY_DN3858_c0_g1~~TRINITY_DN3858_c0_g1_i1.p1  ORF type:complete len:642 (-),score=129.35 TRINITY_DN3858_c0_g1_i1:581-2506(-)